MKLVLDVGIEKHFNDVINQLFKKTTASHASLISFLEVVRSYGRPQTSVPRPHLACNLVINLKPVISYLV